MNDDALPNLAEGIPLAQLPDGGLMTGRVGDEDALLVRRGDAIAAVGAHCTHYHGPLADGLVVGDTIRCPWHHACFSLSTGEALGAPALDPIACWHVERHGDRVVVREKQPAPVARTPATSPSSIVIVGGGAAGLAAADMLRRDGYSGPLTMISADDSAPCDRPNLSKDFLAGTAQEDWIPLRPDEFYRERHIDLVLNARVTSIDTRERRVRLENGTAYPFGALLIATGADPVRLTIPGKPSIDVRYLRTFADSRAIVSRAESAKCVLVIGASFIGLEVAASLRARGIDVHVVAPEHQPLERVLGAEAGRFIRSVHESQGVTFHLGTTVTRIDGRTVVLGDGTTVDVDLVVAGVGVRPSVALAEQAGLAMDRGILVDEHLETSVPGIYAAGDVARWPDPHSGSRIRVEHWVVAERHGQAVAKNMLGARRRFDEVPFFWSQHFDVVINYVGHAETWDAIAIDGSLDARDCTITYRLGGKTLAVATIGRDHASLEAEAAMQAAG
jgi:NADPH-dependent 2,4-dienoyl-CoA reductase/sulfur reductase-like enzyme/nitrite reductase/ring-hydroxylating ferredoxin subunit